MYALEDSCCSRRLFRYRIPIPIRCLFIIILLLYATAVNAEWATRKSDRLLITYQPDDARFADRVLTIARTANAQLISDIGIDPPDTIRIHIAETLDEFRTFTSGAIPDWGEGYAVPDWKLIVLKSPRITGSFENLHEVVVHELAHILLHAAMRSADIPRWLDEGFAMYAAREWGIWDRASLILAVLTDNLVPLGAIQAVNTFPERKAHLAYQESALTVRFIIQRYGRHGLHALLQRLRTTGSVNQACFDAFGISVVQFEREWRRYMEETYGWNAVPSELWSIIIGPLFVILFFFAYVTMRYRRRRILARWAQEEAGEFGWSAEEDEWNRMKREWKVIEGGKK